LKKADENWLRQFTKGRIIDPALFVSVAHQSLPAFRSHPPRSRRGNSAETSVAYAVDRVVNPTGTTKRLDEGGHMDGFECVGLVDRARRHLARGKRGQ
jgi:hypothetical protein